VCVLREMLCKLDVRRKPIATSSQDNHKIVVRYFVNRTPVRGVDGVAGSESLWPYLLLVNAGPALVSLLLMPCLPDSPRYLAITRNRRREAVKGPFLIYASILVSV